MRTTDLLFEDWVAHWRAIFAARDEQAGATRDSAYWDRRAPAFAAAASTHRDGFVELLEPWLSPGRTITDVGAGAGRHAARLAERVDWVTAVEPSQGMRDQMPPRDNMTVIASSWELADPAPADLVICCHVLYGIAEIEPFVRKLELAARERVFIQLRFGQLTTPADPLWELLTGQERRRQPQFGDLYNVLLQMGIRPDVGVLRYEARQRWAGETEFLAEHKTMFGPAWEENAVRTWMASNLDPQADGSLVHDRGITSSGVVHWQPEPRT